uniref:Uncharacterized protein n=1 Tax=Oryctolagus cuniculus TaxID=9986 RepID=G1U9M2_RABIT
QTARATLRELPQRTGVGTPGEGAFPGSSRPGRPRSAGTGPARGAGLRPLCELRDGGRRRKGADSRRPATSAAAPCHPSASGGGRPGLAGCGGEGGVPAQPGRRAQRGPPHRPAAVNKAATRVAHLPETAALRPLSPNRPDHFGPGQRGGIAAQRRRRRRADAGRARAASSGGAVPAAPEVLGTVASLPGRGRPAVVRVAAGSEPGGLAVARTWQSCAPTQSPGRVGRAETTADRAEGSASEGGGQAPFSGVRLPAPPGEIFLTDASLTGSWLHSCTALSGAEKQGRLPLSGPGGAEEVAGSCGAQDHARRPLWPPSCAASTSRTGLPLSRLTAHLLTV